MSTLRPPLDRILDLARWAPSGDNTQPWRFQPIDPYQVAVHAFDTRRDCVYDLDGAPSQMAVGALLENLRIAASTLGLAARIERRPDSPEEAPVFQVQFSPDPAIVADPLAAAIEPRVVQRRPMSTRRLSAADKAALEAAAGPAHRTAWLESWKERWAVSWLLFRNARLRLTMPEAYTVHRDVIAWKARFSEDRIPDQALGVGPLSLRLMRFAMKSWERVAFLNTYMAGTLLPRLQMDLLPGLACAAHLTLTAGAEPRELEDYVRAGAAMQRLWLAATLRGLYLQPEMTPLVFARYVRQGRRFSRAPALWEAAQRLAVELTACLGEAAPRVVFMARIGTGPAPRARSLRRPLEQLLR